MRRKMPTCIAPAQASVAPLVYAWLMVQPSPACIFILTLFLCFQEQAVRFSACAPSHATFAGRAASAKRNVAQMYVLLLLHYSTFITKPELLLVCLFQGREGVCARSVCHLQTRKKPYQV